MFEPQEIRSEHKDVIHDVLYDYYGQRIATCSSDQTVKVNQSATLNQKSICSNELFKITKKKFDNWIFFLNFRFGIRMKKVLGLFRLVGRHILDLYGVYHGHIPNLVPF